MGKCSIIERKANIVLSVRQQQCFCKHLHPTNQRVESVGSQHFFACGHPHGFICRSYRKPAPRAETAFSLTALSARGAHTVAYNSKQTMDIQRKLCSVCSARDRAAASPGFNRACRDGKGKACTDLAKEKGFRYILGAELKTTNLVKHKY